MSEGRRWRTEAPYLLVLLIAAFLATLPLLLHGCSCGHDFDFHLQSWLDAAAQLRHGTFDPSWTISAAWNAGEPRFLFYPPLSWMIGALLTLAFPISSAPLAFTWLSLSLAGLSMYWLARAYVSAPVALLVSAIYLANPYMLFTAFERTAYGELLAAAWLPLLLLSALRRRPPIAGIGIALTLLWLSDAPAAVIGLYALAAIAILRILLALRVATRSQQRPSALIARYAAGGALGLALPAFYLLPAAVERRYVQVAMAIIPNMRVQDNFLFGHTGNAPHDQVLHTASLLAVGLLLVTFIALLAAWSSAPNHRLSSARATRHPLLILGILSCLIAFLLTPASNSVWQHLPELAYLQFPWRLLMLLAVVLALGVALALRNRHTRSLLTAIPASVLSLILALTLGGWAITQFRQPCEAADRPALHAVLFRTHHGVEPTDEYTPANADNDVLRWDDPAYWLSTDPSAFAPNTVPNPAATIVNYDTPPPVDQTVSAVAPRHLVLHLSHPQVLILNLRDYPDWRVTRNGAVLTQHLQRDDGLLAVSLPAGDSTIDVRWRRSWDQILGDAVSLAALLALGALRRRSRTIES